MNRLIASFLLLSGALLVANAAIPIVGYELQAQQTFTRTPQLLSPLGTTHPPVLGARVADFTRASNWFEDSNQPQYDQAVANAIHYYNVSIPKLKIANATVEIGGDDLSKSLIHYKGTALPGRRGNSVVFGHSVLPQFYNPKNYLTIFSKLPTLGLGDEVRVDYDGITYRYEVVEMFEVSPDALEVLAQDTDQQYLTLITCVPPGTYLKRLVVKTKLVPPRL